MCNHTILLDASNTTVAFAVRWLGGVTVRGHFTDLSGVLCVPDGSVERAELRIDVVASSVRTGIALRDRHLRGPQFLHSAGFPLISFRSERIERLNGTVRISGVLSLRGIERPLDAICPVVYANDTGLRSTVRLGARFTVPRIPHHVGVASGMERLNPLLYAIGRDVEVDVNAMVPATELLPALLPALGR